MKPLSFSDVVLMARVWAMCLAATVLLTGQATHKLHSVVAEPPASIQTKIEQAVNSTQPASAELLLEKALQQYPAWREGWWQLGSLAYEQNDYMEGRVAFSTLAKLDPRAGATWVMLGLCDFELRDFGMSLLHIEKGRSLGFPANPQLSDVARYHQALDLIVIEEYEQASYLLDSFAREGHGSPAVTIAEGLAALRIPAVGPMYSREVEPAQLNLVQKVGEAQWDIAEKKIDEARSIYEHLLQQYPRAAGLHYAYGTQLARWGEMTKALAEFKTESELYPDNAAPHLEAAYLLYKNGQYQAALPEAQAAVRLQPSFFAGHFVLGEVLVDQGHLEEGAAELEKSRDLQPGSSQVRYALAQAYLRLHRRADALKEQQAFRRLQPLEASMMQKGTLPVSVFEGNESRPSHRGSRQQNK